MNNETMIKVERETVALLRCLKTIKQEPYNDVIIRLIEEYTEDSLELSSEAKQNIIQGIKDIKLGNTYSSQEALEYIRNRDKGL